MSVRRLLIALTALAVLVMTGAAPLFAQEEGEARLGGGSDIAGDTTVHIPQGGSIPSIHVIFADNPHNEPIEVQFRADAPPGITVEPQWETTTIHAESSVENHFGIEVAPTVASGKHRVVVQLIRSDIEPEPGSVTTIPAIQTVFTVEVTGEAATVAVRAVSALTAEPVAGTITLSARNGEDGWFEVDRAEGATLESRVAPGEYRTAFLLGDRELTSEDFTVEAEEEIEVVLEVETVSFVLAAVKPREENGRVVVAELVASVNNESDPVPGPAALRAAVYHDDTQVDTVTLEELSELPAGISEGTATYRPEGGWQPGTYRFVFELVTPEFTFIATDQPEVEIPAPLRFDPIAFLAALDTREWVALAAAAVLALALIAWLIRFLIVRRRRTRVDAEPSASSPAQDDDRPARRRRWWRRRASPSADEKSWLEQRIGPTTEQRLAWDEGETGSYPAGVLAPPVFASPPNQDSEMSSVGARTLRPHPTLPTAPPPMPPSTRSTTGADNGGDMASLVDALRVIQQLQDHGDLAAGWSITDATLVYWAMSSAQTRDALDSVGMSYEEYVIAMKRLFAHGLLGTDRRR